MNEQLPSSEQKIKSGAKYENVPSGMCAQRTDESAPSHSLISLPWPFGKKKNKKKTNFASLAIQNAPVKILTRLSESAGWSEFSLGAYARRYVI